MLANYLGFVSRLAVIISISILALPGSIMAQAPEQSEKAAYAQEAPSKEEWKVIATSPGVQIIKEDLTSPGKVLPSGESPLDAAQNWLAEKGLVEGRNLVKGKLLYISIGSGSVNALPKDPGYIDSRFLAFQRAELDAKAKTAVFLGVDLTTERGSSERTINPQERAELEDIVNASPTMKSSATMMEVKDTIYGLFQKAKVLANAKMDEQIRKTGSDVGDQQREADRRVADRQARRTRIGNLRNVSEASLRAAASAFADVQATQTIQAFEGSYKNNYQVAVVTLWSQSMQRLVNSMQAGRAPLGLPINEAKDEIAKQLPTNPNELACLTGVRAYINDKGEHVLLAFGQAGVETLGGREDKAFELASKKAQLRAMAAMRAFMGERLAFKANEELREALGLYAEEYGGESGASEYKSISQFQEKITAVANQQKIVGINSLVTKELTHPFTDKSLVLKVMSWSPSSQAMSQQLKEAIEHKPGSSSMATPHRPGQAPKSTPARKGTISSGKGADKDAW